MIRILHLLIIIYFFFFFAPSNSFPFQEEKKIQDRYIEIGIGYPLFLLQSPKMQDMLDQNDWQASLLKFSFFAGYYSSLETKKWLLGPEIGIYVYPYSQKYSKDASLTYWHFLGYLTSKYYIVGETGDGIYISDKIGMSAINIKRQGDGVSDDLGLTFGFALGAGIGYAIKTSTDISLTLNLYFLWDSIGAQSSDGYSLDTKGIHLWIGILF